MLSVLGWIYIRKFRVWCVSSSCSIGRWSSQRCSQWCPLKYYYHSSILLMVCSVTSCSKLRDVNFVLLTFNFTRGHFWSYEWLLKALSSTRLVLGRSQKVIIVFLMNSFSSMAMIPVQYEKMVVLKSFCSQ